MLSPLFLESIVTAPKWRCDVVINIIIVCTFLAFMVVSAVLQTSLFSATANGWWSYHLTSFKCTTASAWPPCHGTSFTLNQLFLHLLRVCLTVTGNSSHIIHSYVSEVKEMPRKRRFDRIFKACSWATRITPFRLLLEKTISTPSPGIVLCYIDVCLTNSPRSFCFQFLIFSFGLLFW